jgi:hypothetical protein
MKVPVYVDTPIADKDGNLTDAWRQIFTQLLQ